MTTEQILSDLENFNGTENYFKIPLSKFKHTDGINYLIEKCGCGWLISDTAIYLSMIKEKYDFLVLSVKVAEDKSCLVELKEDTDLKPIYSKKYAYTDFPLKEFEFYIVNDVMLLKSEY